MEQQNVYLYVFDTLSDWEPGFAVSGINNPAYQLNPGSFVIKTVSISKQPVKTTGGITIIPDVTFAEIDVENSAMLILPGGSGWESGQHPEAIDEARHFLKAGKPVAAICGATAGLALAGILDHVCHTSNELVYLQATGYKGDKYYQDEAAVTDGNVITAGTAASLDFAYHIFKRLGIYSDETLKAWYGLYKTGELKYFRELQKSGA